MSDVRLGADADRGDTDRGARRLSALLLAAGAGRRFGGDKLSAPLSDGTPVGVTAARHLLAAGYPVYAVVRCPECGIAPVLEQLGVQLVPCRDAHRGLGHSLACGVRASADADGWLVALADMPFVQPASISAVAHALARGAPMAAPAYAGRRGHPVGFAAHFRQQLLALRGDVGARQLLRAHADRLVAVAVDDPGVLRDVDRPADLLAEGLVHRDLDARELAPADSSAQALGRGTQAVAGGPTER